MKGSQKLASSVRRACSEGTREVGRDRKRGRTNQTAALGNKLDYWLHQVGREYGSARTFFLRAPSVYVAQEQAEYAVPTA